MPALDIAASYGLSGLGGTQFARSGLGGAVTRVVPGGYGDALGNIKNLDAPNWNIAMNLSYPIGASAADANLARARLNRTGMLALWVPLPCFESDFWMIARNFTDAFPHVLAWARDLMAAAQSPLVPGSQYAGGALIAVDPNGQEAKLELRKFHIDVHIEDGFARTTIDQTFFNQESWQMEGTFYFPLPPDASLSRLAMYVDGQLMEGGMVGLFKILDLGTEADPAAYQLVARMADIVLILFGAWLIFHYNLQAMARRIAQGREKVGVHETEGVDGEPGKSVS
jgi:hypothetical protein